MHSENDIRKAVRILVEKYGELTTSELKEKMPEVIEYDADDLKKSSTRKGETMILQKIRNITSHQVQDKKIYDEGFCLTKNVPGIDGKSQAVFSAITGIGDNAKEITEAEKRERKRNAANEELQGPFRKVDWNAVNERRTEIGAKGEEFVYEQERQAAIAISPELAERVIHLSVEQGDGFGFDILSVDKNGETVRIEVKTTQGKANTPFYMSKNERNFFRAHKKSAFLYRVYDFDPEKKRGKIQKIPAQELLKNYDFEEVSYMVTKK
jgi:hypothetical protein